VRSAWFFSITILTHQLFLISGAPCATCLIKGKGSACFFKPGSRACTQCRLARTKCLADAAGILRVKRTADDDIGEPSAKKQKGSDLEAIGATLEAHETAAAVGKAALLVAGAVKELGEKLDGMAVFFGIKMDRVTAALGELRGAVEEGVRAGAVSRDANGLATGREEQRAGELAAGGGQDDSPEPDMGAEVLVEDGVTEEGEVVEA
jgi:hypothetical protein